MEFLIDLSGSDSEDDVPRLTKQDHSFSDLADLDEAIKSPSLSLNPLPEEQVRLDQLVEPDLKQTTPCLQHAPTTLPEADDKRAPSSEVRISAARAKVIESLDHARPSSPASSSESLKLKPSAAPFTPSPRAVRGALASAAHSASTISNAGSTTRSIIRTPIASTPVRHDDQPHPTDDASRLRTPSPITRQQPVSSFVTPSRPSPGGSLLSFAISRPIKITSPVTSPATSPERKGIDTGVTSDPLTEASNSGDWVLLAEQRHGLLTPPQSAINTRLPLSSPREESAPPSPRETISPVSQLTASLRAFSLEPDSPPRSSSPAGIETPGGLGLDTSPLPSPSETSQSDHPTPRGGTHAELPDENPLNGDDFTSADPYPKDTSPVEDERKADEHVTLEAVASGLREEALILEDLWDRQKDGFFQFSAGIEETIARLHNLGGKNTDMIRNTDQQAEQKPAERDKIQSAPPGDQIIELHARNVVLHAEMRSALEKREHCEARLAKVLKDRKTLKEKEKLWEKQKELFEARYFQLEDKISSWQAGESDDGTNRKAGVTVVLLEASTKMFPPALVERGFAGGEAAARDILASVKQGLSSRAQHQSADVARPATQTPLVHLYVDALDLLDAYILRSYSCKLSSIKKFLDGFASVDEKISVIDGERADKRLQAHAKFWLGLRDCAAIVVSLDDARATETLRRYDKIFFVSGNEHDDDDARTIRTSVIFRAQPSQSTQMSIRGASTRATSPASTIRRTPSPTATVRSGYSRADLETPRPHGTHSPARTADLIRVRPLVSPPTEMRGRRMSPPPSPVKKVKPAPWAAGPASQAPPMRAPAPVRSTGGSMLDQLNAGSSINLMQTPSTASRRVEGSPTPKKSLRDRMSGRPEIVVPYAPDEEPSASPPDSDEDTPSVNLPHSAVKHVQRPTAISHYARSASPGSVSAASITSSRASVASKWKPIGGPARPVHNATTSGSNATPLGRPRVPTGPAAMADRIHGFKIHK